MFKDTVVQSHVLYTDADGVTRLRIRARPNAWHRDDCPWCGRRGLPRYDRQAAGGKVWRGLDFAGVIVEIECATHRVTCPEHGVVAAAVPWAYPRSAVSRYMRIDWQTVGGCVSRALRDLEPERGRRLDGLVNIGIDETGYRKGCKFVTVVVNHDTNTVVWVGDGARQVGARTVLQEPVGRTAREYQDGDRGRGPLDHGLRRRVHAGVRALRRPVPCRRMGDGRARRGAQGTLRAAREQAGRIAGGVRLNRGRPRAGDGKAVAVREARKVAAGIKGSVFALGKAPENLTDGQRARLGMIRSGDPKLYRAYRLKESLRLLPETTDADQDETDLKHWLWWASHSRIPASRELYAKIKRRKEHIPDTIRLGTGNARVEARNNKIKLIIRKAYGFRNVGNMMDMIYLVCSGIHIPLPNRKPTT